MSRRRPLVILDHLINLGHLRSVLKSYTKKQSPIQVIDNMLTKKHSPRRKRIVQKPVRYSPQLTNKARPSVVSSLEPSGICPKCNVYVKGSDDDNGVVCVKCDAFWHFNCADVSQQILDTEWKGIEFVCALHRNENVLVGEKDLMDLNEASDEYIMMGNSLVSNVKINNYKLNIGEKLQDKLKNLDSKMLVCKRDGGGQYKVNLNSTTYQLIVDNIMIIGNTLGGIRARRGDVDLSGAGVQVQHIITIKGRHIDVAVTFYHTNSSLLLQLLGNRSTTKMNNLKEFVYVDFERVVETLESTSNYGLSRETLKLKIEQELVECSKSLYNDNNVLRNSSSGSGVISCMNQQVIAPPGVRQGDGETVIEYVGNNECNEPAQNKNIAANIVCTEDKAVCNIGQTNVDDTITMVSLKGSDENGCINDEGLTNQNMVPLEEKVEKGDINEKVIKGHNQVSSDALVLVKKKTSDEIAKKKVLESLNVLSRRKGDNESERSNNLFNIIVKLKEKGDEMRRGNLMTFQNTANERINELTLKLVSKQNENIKLLKKQKDLETQVVDLKKKKVILETKLKDMGSIGSSEQLSKCIQENDTLKQQILTESSKCVHLSNDLALKENQIVGFKEINDGLRQKLANHATQAGQWNEQESELNERIRVLEGVAGDVQGLKEINDNLRQQIADHGTEVALWHRRESEFKEKIKVLEAIAGDVNNKDNDGKDEKVLKEVKSLRSKLDECNKNNSLLKDKLEETTHKLSTVDSFYQDIIGQKDTVLKEYCSIIKDDTNETIKVKRLLTKFRTENEVKLVNELKVSLSNSTLIGEEESTADCGDNDGKENEKDKSIDKEKDKSSALNSRGQKRLCREGRQCTNRSVCGFRHEMINKACRFGDRCNKKQRCLFLHVLGHDSDNGYGDRTGGSSGQVDLQPYANDVFLSSDTRYSNERANSGVEFVSGVRPTPNHMTYMNESAGGYFYNEVKPQNEKLVTKGKLCVKGRSCVSQNRGCMFRHEPLHTPCRNGLNCANKNTTCLFLHSEGSNIGQDSQRKVSSMDENFGGINRWLRAKN